MVKLKMNDGRYYHAAFWEYPLNRNIVLYIALDKNRSKNCLII